ncbi:hypothetical protein ACQJBY_004474 [Aegilops geniculata]
MLAVRCAARRLGAVLQRTQATVPEEGRRLVPSRFMRSQQLSTKPACETWMQKKTQKLRSWWAHHKAEIEKGMREPVEEDEFKLLVESYSRTIDGVIHGTAKMALLVLVPVAVYTGYTKEGMNDGQAQAVSNGDQ